MFECLGPALSPDKSHYRTSAVLGLHLSGKRIYQDLRSTMEERERQGRYSI